MEPSNTDVPIINTQCNVFATDNQGNPNQRVQIFNYLLNLATDYWTWLLHRVVELKSHCFRPISNIKLTLTADASSLEGISQTRGWRTAAVRCMEFHPTTSLMALLTNRDIVLLHDEKKNSPTRLKSIQQKDVTCAAFRPWSDFRELAVGCAAGICLWRENQRSNMKHNIRNMTGSHQLRVLQDEGHNYVTSIQWNEDGTILISAALGTSHIILWEPDCQQKITLIPAPDSLSSFSLLRYSPNFQILFCASCEAGASLCQLNRSKWMSEQILMHNHIQAAIWTTCSTFLLFVQEGSTRIYSCTDDAEAGVFLHPKPLWSVELVADLEEVTTCSGHKRCCGQPQAFAMDPLGVYMAIIFKKQSFILLCYLVDSKLGSVRLIPIEFIECDAEGEQYPTCIGFKVSDLEIRWLMIAWSTGYIQRFAITAKKSQIS
ncbi:aladin [Drosophila eugracilis]|uniref:aladin n=1 Tax=Drosophila eugracilis TaxID=29029 RepID=UPI001BDAE07A|nr:aladin [Drosophila eugracilis]